MSKVALDVVIHTCSDTLKFIRSADTTFETLGTMVTSVFQIRFCIANTPLTGNKIVG